MLAEAVKELDFSKHEFAWFSRHTKKIWIGTAQDLFRSNNSGNNDGGGTPNADGRSNARGGIVLPNRPVVSVKNNPPATADRAPAN
jgi:hypothetical protein